MSIALTFIVSTDSYSVVLRYRLLTIALMSLFNVLSSLPNNTPLYPTRFLRHLVPLKIYYSESFALSL